MPSPNRPDLSADALWYERAVFMGALSSWMTFGEQHLNPVGAPSLLTEIVNSRDDMCRLSADNTPSRRGFSKTRGQAKPGSHCVHTHNVLACRILHWAIYT